MVLQLLLIRLCVTIFFFKQKTAYEMRISDWSSDVCSSDLSHSDHFGGVGGIVTAEQVAKEKIRIIAPHGFSEEATAENVLAGGAMGRRALYMFGAILAPGPTGQGDTRLGPKLSSGTIGYMEPAEEVTDAGAALIGREGQPRKSQH